MTSPPHPSTVQRELVEPVNPDNPVDIPRDITVGLPQLPTCMIHISRNHNMIRTYVLKNKGLCSG
jgi:hypothetical protein